MKEAKSFFFYFKTRNLLIISKLMTVKKVENQDTTKKRAKNLDILFLSLLEQIHSCFVAFHILRRHVSKWIKNICALFLLRIKRTCILIMSHKIKLVKLTKNSYRRALKIFHVNRLRKALGTSLINNSSLVLITLISNDAANHILVLILTEHFLDPVKPELCMSK